jgi:L-fucose isomerase-like protein
VGKALRTTSGTWSTSATFTYQWLRCSATFTDCTNIPGATATSYTIRAADVGHLLAANVTATNAERSASALSSGKGLVEAKAPFERAPRERGSLLRTCWGSRRAVSDQL